jgi:hypothetical protein
MARRYIRGGPSCERRVVVRPLVARIKYRYTIRMSVYAGKKSNRGRPRVDSEEVFARFDRRLLDALDAWIAAHPEPRPSRPEAIRRILSQALGNLADAGSIAAEDLNANNDE